ncbi:hypothetical protein [Streptomyces similanensis]|uniref:DUF4328 domain-containing protein n=1 Tax=Streptomyces similanensis TaxID=1274988 RepID=A0ABP9LK82_9ACTN
MYALTLYVLLVTGLLFALGFLSLHRPRYFFRLTEVNASYWVIVVALWYVRSLTLLVIRGAHPTDLWWDILLSLGLLAAIDVLLIVRFCSYLAFLRNHPKGPPTAS